MGVNSKIFVYYLLEGVKVKKLEAIGEGGLQSKK